jgi:hypothetical protein
MQFSAETTLPSYTRDYRRATEFARVGVSIAHMRTGLARGALLALLAVAGAPAGCSSGGGSSDGGTDGGPDAPPLCGDVVCAASQLCVSQQSCGTQQCSPVPASGTCPPGSTATGSCPATGQPGCLEACAATFSCQARPAACAAMVDCTCAAPLCAGSTCIATMGSRVACAAQ